MFKNNVTGYFNMFKHERRVEEIDRGILLKDQVMFEIRYGGWNTCQIKCMIRNAVIEDYAEAEKLKLNDR